MFSGPILTTKFTQILTACLQNLASDVELLLDAKIEFDLAAAKYGKVKAMRRFSNQTLRLAHTTRMDENQSPAGFLLPDVAAIDMGSTLLMTQGEVDQFNAEIASAFNEVLNVMLGGWKLAAPTSRDRLNNAPEARKVDAYTADGLDEFLDEHALELIEVPLTFNGATYPFGVVGSPAWFGLKVHTALDTALGSSSDRFPAGQSREDVSGEALHAVAEPGEQLTAKASTDQGNNMQKNGVQPATGDARMMLVDLSGTLNKWLKEQLQKGTLELIRPSSDMKELDEQSTVLIVGPRPELFRNLDIPQCVVSKLRDADENDNVNLS